MARPLSPVDQAAMIELDHAVFDEMLDQLRYVASVLGAEGSFECLTQVTDFTGKSLAISELLPLVRLSGVVRDPTALDAVTAELLRAVDVKITVITRNRSAISAGSATCGKDPKFGYLANRANLLADRAAKVLGTVRAHLAESASD